MIITIDGPTASGKSSTARAVAQQLHFFHLNSGLLYRALAYVLLTRCAYTQEQLIQPQKDDVQAYLNPEHIIYSWDSDGYAHITIEWHDVTNLLKDPAIAQAASIISVNKTVRDQVTTYIRWLANEHDIVADGRDCGTELFPTAELKIFLTASVAVRAERWQKEQESRGCQLSHEQAQAQIVERDTRDSQRTIAPLRIPESAAIVDNSDMTFEQTVADIVALARTIIIVPV